MQSRCGMSKQMKIHIPVLIPSNVLYTFMCFVTIPSLFLGDCYRSILIVALSVPKHVHDGVPRVIRFVRESI